MAFQRRHRALWLLLSFVLGGLVAPAVHTLDHARHHTPHEHTEAPADAAYTDGFLVHEPHLDAGDCGFFALLPATAPEVPTLAHAEQVEARPPMRAERYLVERALPIPIRGPPTAA